MLSFANQIITNKREMEEREMCLDETGRIECVPLTYEGQAYRRVLTLPYLTIL